MWTFTFTGSGRTKYSNELLELTCNFEFEYSAELQTAVLNNWLCNLSGHPGCWFPMDLLQEKNIKQLKKMSQRRDVTFGGDFFQEIIALNIRAFLQSTKSTRRSVQLADRGESHVHTDKEAAQNELLRHMAQSNLHKFCPGRMQGHIAKDDLAMGYRRLADTSKIADFIERTLRDAGAIHADVLEEESEVNVENHTMPILPNMTLDGRLVVGDEFEINSFTHHIATDEAASSLGTTGTDEDVWMQRSDEEEDGSETDNGSILGE